MNKNLKVLNAEISNAGWVKTLPKRIKVLSWGKNSTTDGDVYLNDETVKVFDEQQKAMGRDEDVALDFGHCTVPGATEYKQGEPKKIAAYGNPELIKGDGLYLRDLEWTDEGKKNAKNYKDLSPAVKCNDNGVVLGLHSVALTETGAVYGLKFYSVKQTKTMLKKYSKDYNKDGANPGLKYSGEGKLDESNVNLHPKTADDTMTDTTFDSNEPATYAGADKNWDETELGNHKDLCETLDADDHESEYGDVDYADKENHKYPINNEEHIRAAWSYINMPKNADKYDSEQLSSIKGHIKSAAEKHGIDIESDDKKTETKTMSATTNKLPLKVDAWRGALPMNNEILKKMAAEVGMDNESDESRVLEAFLAKYVGLLAEVKGQITNKENSSYKQFSVKFNELENQIKTLKADKDEEHAKRVEFEKNSIVSQATKEGKYIPYSADTIKKIDVSVLKELVENTPKGFVPMDSKLRTFNATASTREGSKQRAIELFNQNVREQNEKASFNK